MEEPHWCWRLPQTSMPQSEIDAALRDALGNCINYKDDPVLGFPGTTPSEVAINTHHLFAPRQTNSLGYHTKEAEEDPSEMGFLGVQKLERDFVYGVADMIGVEDPPKEIDGYICSGGTEGNYHGLWLARNKLWEERLIKPHERGEIVVLSSHLFHYSLPKAFGRLLGGDPKDRDSALGIIEELPTNEKGELTPKMVEEYVRQYHQHGYRRFAIFLTAGTTNLGSVDPVGAINNALEELIDELGIAVEIHVDAAFGGFILPFIEPGFHFAFQHSLVSSVVLDAHKTGGAIYSAGVFLCRKDFLEHTGTNATYIFGHKDHTVPGSRSGAITAACWATLMHHGREGYTAIAQEGIRMRDYLADKFREFSGAVVFPSRINILTVSLTPSLDKEIRKRYCIVSDTFPNPLSSRVRSKTGLIDRTQEVYRFTLMPHVTEAKIDKFFAEWQQ